MNDEDLEECDHTRASYTPCSCRDKLSFKDDSPLQKYLETRCKGWVPDTENKYTLNYVLLVLIANLKEANLITEPIIRLSSELQDLFEENFIHIQDLRHKVRSFFKGNLGQPTKVPPFYCIIRDKHLIEDLFGPSYYKVISINFLCAGTQGCEFTPRIFCKDHPRPYPYGLIN